MKTIIVNGCEILRTHPQAFGAFYNNILIAERVTRRGTIGFVETLDGKDGRDTPASLAVARPLRKKRSGCYS